MTSRTASLLGGLGVLALAGLLSLPAIGQAPDPSQEDEAAEAAPSEAAEEDEGELDPADLNAAPFPPGRHAAETRRVCTECHPANMVLQRTYTYDEAVRFYQIMVTSNIETEQAQNVIEYLSTTLAP